MNRKKIIDILGQLQEGFIEELKMESGDLNMKVECRHIADLIDPSYSAFYVVLKGVKDFYFRPWDDEDIMITSPRELQLMKPDILNVEMGEGDYVKIYSNCENVYSGGNIFVIAEDIKIYDEGLNELDLDTIVELSDRYWFSSNKAEG